MSLKPSFFLNFLALTVVFTALLPYQSISATSQPNSNTNTAQNQNFVPGQVLVKFKSNHQAAGSADISAISGLSIKSGSSQSNFSSVNINSISSNGFKSNSVAGTTQDKQKTLDTVKQLQSDPNVEYAEPNYIFKDSSYTSNDPLYTNGTLWGLNNTGQNGGTVDKDINAPEAWNTAASQPGVKIAILDSGVDYTHPDLAANIDLLNTSGAVTPGNINGYNFCDVANCTGLGNNNPMDDYGHGTMVAGIAAAVGQNNIGGIGACPKCTIMPIKVIDSSGNGTASSITSGIYYAIDHGAKVISMSLGAGGITSQSIHNAIAQAVSQNIIVVAAAGNCGDSSFASNGCSYQNQPVYPGSDSNVIAVGSIDRNGNKSSFSNANSYVDVVAPGEDIVSTIPSGKYVDSSCNDSNFGTANDGFADCSGTSMSTPYVAGGIGLMLSVNPNLNFYSVKNILQSTSKDIGAAGYDIQTGYGIMDLNAAVNQAPQVCTSAPTNFYCVELYNNNSLSGYPVAQINAPDIVADWGQGSPGYNLPNDNFSLRWLGQFNFDAGDYTFITNADDGMRVYIDNVLFINRWNPVGGQQRVLKNITAGLHTIRVEYFEGVGNASADFVFGKGDCINPTNNYCAEYYKNTDLSGFPSKIDSESSINYNWGLSGPDGLTPNNFSVKWWGQFNFTDAQDTVFNFSSDDGDQLLIDGNLVSNHWFDQGATPYTYRQVLTPGSHNITYNYYQRSAYASAQLSYQKAQSVIFANTNFTGNSCTLANNTNYPTALNIAGCSNNMNDIVKSMQIPYGVCIDAYQDINYQGFKVTYCNTQANYQVLNLSLVDSGPDKQSINGNVFSSFKVYDVSRTDPDKVFFYVDAGYSGYSSYLQTGDFIQDARQNVNGVNRNKLTVGNDNISSFTLPSGKCVELYADIIAENNGGIMRKYCNNSPNFGQVTFAYGQWENDQLSAVKVYDTTVNNTTPTDTAVKFWSNNDQTGTLSTLNAPSNLPNLTNPSTFSVGDNQVSSFELAPRTCADIYELPNYQGWDYTYCDFSTTDRLFVPFYAGWRENDNASSIKVYTF
jgi:serine protease